MVFLPAGLTLLNVQAQTRLARSGWRPTSPGRPRGQGARGASVGLPGVRRWPWGSGPGPGLCPPQRGLRATAWVGGARAPPELQTVKAADRVTGDGGVQRAAAQAWPCVHPVLPTPALVCSCPAEAPSPRWGLGSGQAPRPPRSPGYGLGLRSRYGARAPHGRLSVETRHLETWGPLQPSHSLPSPLASLEGTLPSCFGVGTRCPRCSGPARTPKETATG